VNARLGIALVGLLLTGGCAAQSSDDSFENVQTLISKRIGQHIQWNHHTKDDQAAEQAVTGLLSKDLTEEAAIQIALLNNRDLQATYESLGIAQADLVQAGLLKNPVFSAAIEAADAGRGVKIQMSLVEDFISILQIPLRKRIAGAELRAAELMSEKAVVELSQRVQEAVLRQEAALELVDLRTSQKEAAEAGLDLAQRMHNAGNSPDIELYQRQLRREETEINLLSAQQSVNDGREELNSLMGLDGEQTKWTIAAKLSDLPDVEISTEEIEKQAAESNFDLGVLRWQIELAAAKAGVAKSYGWLTDAQIGPSMEKEADHGPWETGGTFSVPLPIFDFGQAEKARATSELRRQRDRYLAMAVQIRSAARQANMDLTTARLRAASLGRVIAPLKKKIVEQIQLQYNGMLAGTFELLEARENQTDADAQAVEALRDYWLARSRVESIIAGSIGDK
jgi:cobalt-zinc-cadmium efflux system outer membrane protein